MPGELPVLPVYRHEVARPDQRQHELQLFLAAVPGHVDVLDPLVDDLGAAPGDVVHHPADGLLVARDLPRREHHDVVGLELDVAVVVDGDPRQRRLRLALRPGADADDVLRRGSCARRCRGSARPAGIRRYPSRCAISEFSMTPAADERDPAIELRREIDQDLHPVDARREHRDDDLARRALVKISSNPSMTSTLGAGEALADRRSCCRPAAPARPPTRAPRAGGTSTCSPSSGVWSILKSPVWITTPARRRRSRAPRSRACCA